MLKYFHGSAFFIALLLFVAQPAVSQDRQIDSLKSVVGKSPEDTSKVNLLLILSKKHFNSSPSDAIVYANQARELALRLNFKKGAAFAYKNAGIGYFNQGNYFEAIQNYNRSLELFGSIKDTAGVANMYSNIGNIYFNQGDDLKAIENFVRSLKLSEEIEDTLRIGTALINIGAVYMNKEISYDRAIDYLQRALALCETATKYRPVESDQGAKYLDMIGTITVNLGEIYAADWKRGDDSIALDYFNRSIKAYEGTENLPYALNDIGKLYAKMKEYDKAVSYLKRGYEIAKALDAKNDMAITLEGLAFTLKEKGDYASSLKYFKEAESAADETGAKYLLKDIYGGLSSLYAGMGDYSKAFNYQTRLLAIKDTIYNIDQDKKLQGVEFNYQIEKKQSQINLLTKDQELKQQEIKRQKLVRNGFIGGFAIMLLFAGVFFTQRNRISREKKRSEELLLNILPEETAEELKATGTAKAKGFDQVTVMFTDFKGFTHFSEKLTPQEIVSYINDCFSEFDRIILRYGIEKIKTIGDAYMCAGGLPTPNLTHAEDIVKAGLEMQEYMRRMNGQRSAAGLPLMELRVGIHTGPVVAGIVGIKKFAYDIWGDTVNTASRMESSGEPGKVNISGTTYELIKEKFVFSHRGKVQAKNKGEIDMYFVESLA
jgi:class 3 adenylate cyclase/tetratricopeptide (TPR) repeat protein